LTGGIAPLLGGRLLTGLAGWQVWVGGFSLDAYGLLFLISLVSFAGSVLLYAKVSPDSEFSAGAALRRYLPGKHPPTVS
jgi:hypothetical protein